MESSPADRNLIYNPSKAGLPQNYQSISEKITEVSKDTKYFQFQKERAKAVSKKIDEMKLKLESASSTEMDFARLKADSIINVFLSKHNFSNVFIHADFDAFFASVEAIIDPSLKGTAFAVGGSIKHGVISTSSYEARKFGVRSGMAIFIALSLCPHLNIVKSHYSQYIKYSNLVQDIFREYDPNFISHGLDEATLNISSIISKGRDMREIAEEIQKRVYDETKLTISLGVASTTQLAKIASDINKPNGIFIMPFESESLRQVLSPLKIRKIPGIGGIAETKLQSLGIETIGDIILKRAEISLVCSDIFLRFLLASAIGCPIPPHKHSSPKQQSYSLERTFDATNDLNTLIDIIQRISKRLAEKMQELKILARSLTVKFKDAQFQVFEKAFTFENPSSKTVDFVNASIAALMNEHRSKHLKLRLIGVKASNLIYPEDQKQKLLTQYLFSKSEEQVKENSTLDNETKQLDFDEKTMMQYLEEESEEELANMMLYEDSQPEKENNISAQINEPHELDELENEESSFVSEISKNESHKHVPEEKIHLNFSFMKTPEKQNKTKQKQKQNKKQTKKTKTEKIIPDSLNQLSHFLKEKPQTHSLKFSLNYSNPPKKPPKQISPKPAHLDNFISLLPKHNE